MKRADENNEIQRIEHHDKIGMRMFSTITCSIDSTMSKEKEKETGNLVL